MGKIDPVGGQALIEGVLMRSSNGIAMSCRLSTGKIVSRVLRKVPVSSRRPWNVPFLRGAVVMAEMLLIGYDALAWSANQQLGKDEKMTTRDLVFTMLFAFLATIGVFVVAPYYLTLLFTSEQGVVFSLVDGVIRLLLFLAYLLIIGCMSDVRNLFEYHGAEHKAVHCHESGKRLTPKNVLSFPKEHPRCGTSYLLITLIVAILTYAVITTESTILNIFLRILLLPIIAGVSYELLKLAARASGTLPGRVLVTPGLWLQKLTTREPSARQAEVAIVALKNALK